VSPLRGEKPQNWPLSKLNTGRFALRAMLPVIRVNTLCLTHSFDNHDLPVAIATETGLPMLKCYFKHNYLIILTSLRMLVGITSVI